MFVVSAFSLFLPIAMASTKPRTLYKIISNSKERLMQSFNLRFISELEDDFNALWRGLNHSN